MALKRSKRRRSAPDVQHSTSEPEYYPEWIEELRRRVASEPGKRPFADKLGIFVTELMELSERSLVAAAHEEDPHVATFRAMQSSELLLNHLRKFDPLSDALLRGIEAKLKLVRDHGGVIPTEDVSKLMGITPQAVSRKRASRKLLGLFFRSKGYMYPACQFTAEGSVLPGLEAVLLELGNVDDWGQYIFLVSSNLRLDSRSPLELLREGRVLDVINAAKSYLEHGAA